MSYCRFSSDNWKCDVYCYHSESGFVIHVASKRHVGDTPIPELPLDWHKLPPAEMWAVNEAQRRWLDAARLEPIGLPHDGQTFEEDTANYAADTLEMLRDEGYWVPQYAIDALREEASTDEIRWTKPEDRK